MSDWLYILGILSLQALFVAKAALDYLRKRL